MRIRKPFQPRLSLMLGLLLAFAVLALRPVSFAQADTAPTPSPCAVMKCCCVADQPVHADPVSPLSTAGAQSTADVQMALPPRLISLFYAMAVPVDRPRVSYSETPFRSTAPLARSCIQRV